MKNRILYLTLLVVSSLFLNNSVSAQLHTKKNAPFLGWNSYNCYGSHINEKYTMENLEAFIEKLKPHGYEYFVLDAGWYQHYELKPLENWPTDGDKKNLSYDKYGRLIPSLAYFPNGLKTIIDFAHKHRIKFGLHLMRGIPREVVKKNLPIKGTRYSARDIVNMNDTCNWSSLNYGIDMSKSGAQEYYDSVLELLADWGVDFIKYDDIVHKPKEINAVANAIEKAGRDIVLSISPGDDIDSENYKIYQRVDMIRISRDIWDLQEDIDISFERWEKALPYANNGFWLDLDMIPFGHIRINYPMTKNKLHSTRGYERMDYFTYTQKKTFITQRAMAASPLFMGGDLNSSPSIVFELITNSDMLSCNQNGITGELVTRISDYSEKVDVWKTPHKTNADEGWIGIFNRKSYSELIRINKEALGLRTGMSYTLYDIWGKKIIDDSESFVFEIPANDVIFIKYSSFPHHK